MAIKTLTNLGKRIGEHRENFNKGKYQTEVTEVKNTVTELKTILEGFNSRLDEA